VGFYKKLPTGIKYRLKLLIPDRLYIQVQYRRFLNQSINIDKPVTFSQKLQWLKIYWRDPLLPTLVDKYLVRKYVANKIGDSYLNKIIGIYNSENEIEFNSLPNKFVLKTTHASGYNVLCKDKSQLNWQQVKTNLHEWLSMDYFYMDREWAYKNVQPRILCEEYLDDHGNSPPDYKIFCFSGVAKFIQVDVGRFTDHRRNIYDLNWNMLDVVLKYKNNGTIEVPENLDEMISVAERLSAGLVFCRVDLYSFDKKIIFGEMTFYPGSGTEKITPDKYEYLWGEYLDLSKVNQSKPS
jgi:hypothetical protein